jgi:hypothetical protein
MAMVDSFVLARDTRCRRGASERGIARHDRLVPARPGSRLLAGLAARDRAQANHPRASDRVIAEIGGFAHKYSGGFAGPTVIGRALDRIQVLDSRTWTKCDERSVLGGWPLDFFLATVPDPFGLFSRACFGTAVSFAARKDMERYTLEEAMSGVEDSFLWVTLGFSSELEAHDVLHIVCATVVDTQDREGGIADLYLERFDQAYSCYGGAELVVVTPSSVEVRLTQAGGEALEFEGGRVFFDVPAGLASFGDALQILRKMTSLECGQRVRVEMGG